MDLRWEILAGYGPLFLDGLRMTIQLTVVSIGAGLLLGVLLGLVSSSRDAPPPKSVPLAWLLKAARGVTLAYVTFFRGTPLFVQILLVHFALMPTLIHPDHGLLLAGDAAREFRQNHGAFFSGALALTLNAGAYISEIFRAGIQSIHAGQTQAAYSLGLTYNQSMRHVVLPLIGPSIVGIGMFGFTLSWDEIARTSQAIGDVNTLPLELQGLTSTVTTPAIYALGTVTTVVSLLVMGLALCAAALLGRRSKAHRT